MEEKRLMLLGKVSTVANRQCALPGPQFLDTNPRPTGKGQNSAASNATGLSSGLQVHTGPLLSLLLFP